MKMVVLNIIHGEPIGYEYRYSGFHYNEGGWKLWERYIYPNKYVSEWVEYPNIFVSRQDAVDFGFESSLVFFGDLNRRKT